MSVSVATSSDTNHGVRRHLFALILFPLLSLVWVGDTLFLGRDLSAFDVVMSLPHWKAEHEYHGVQQLILSDSPQAHYPERALKWRATRQGERIDFNPYIFTGVPELSQGVGAFISSPFQMFMDVSEAIDWSTWLRLALAGLFMYGFLIALELRPEAAILGGVMWAFNMHQMVWLEFPQHLATQLWIPVLFCFNYLILRRGWNWETVLGILICNAFFFTSDYTQIVLYTYVAIGLFNTIYLLAESDSTWREKASRWFSVHAVFVLSAVLLLPGVIVEMRLLSDGLRGHQDWRPLARTLDWDFSLLATAFKDMFLDIKDFKRYFSPNFFGGLWGVRFEGQKYFGNVVTLGVYVGVAMFVLAPLSLLWLRDRTRRPFLLASIGLLLFGFAMVHKNPLFIKFFSLVPMGGFGEYGRFITIVTMLLCTLSAVGLHALMQLKESSAKRGLFALLILVALSPAVVRVVDPSITLSKMTYPLVMIGILAVAAGIVLVFKRWRWVASVVVVFAVVDLLVATYGFNPRMGDEENFPTTKTLDLLLADDSDYRVAQVSRKLLYPPNVLQWYGIPEIGGYLTVAPQRYIDFVKNTIDEYHITANGQLFFFTPNLDIFRLLNVKYLLSLEEMGDERLTLVRKAPNYWVYKMNNALPRVFCGSDMLTLPSEKGVLHRLKKIASSYDRPIALVGDAKNKKQLTSGCAVQDIKAKLNGVSFTVSSDADTYVLASYGHYENWKARSGDSALPVLRANYNMVALPVSPGTHKIDLSYEDTFNLWFQYVMVALGLFVIAWFFLSRQRTLTSGLLLLSSIVLVAYSLLDVPQIANTDLPERPPAQIALD